MTVRQIGGRLKPMSWYTTRFFLMCPPMRARARVCACVRQCMCVRAYVREFVRACVPACMFLREHAPVRVRLSACEYARVCVWECAYIRTYAPTCMNVRAFMCAIALLYLYLIHSNGDVNQGSWSIQSLHTIRLDHDVWIAAIAWFRTRLETRMSVMCVCF